MSYLRNAPVRGVTPQNRPLAGQVPNSAGGHAWKVDALTRLRRFLILGAEGGSYYATERDLMYENVTALEEADPIEAIALICEVSDDGLAPKNDPAIYALAWYATHSDETVRQAALASVGVVCRTATHLFHFAAFIDPGGPSAHWGRAKRRAFGEWYTGKDIDSLAYQVIKYRQRDGWSHKDLLRLTHPATKVSSGNPTVEVSEEHAHLFDWIAHGDAVKGKKGLPQYVRGYRRAMKAETPKDTAELVVKYNLPHEAINPDHKQDPRVWRALLETGMPLGALVRNLPSMTRAGVIIPMTKDTAKIAKRITDEENIKRARMHPLQLLIAHLTYASGHSLRGSATWDPVHEITDALDSAFYKSFKYLEPTGKRHMLALDISASMGWKAVNGIPGLTPRVASAAMAMATMATGDPYMVTAFTTGLKVLSMSAKQSLRDVCNTVSNLPHGGTDCALPMLYALEKGLGVDVFVVYTDNETWHGHVHPAEALRLYRNKTGISAKLVVVGMVANDFSIADPNDSGMLDIVGFDASAPAVIQNFAGGKI